MALVTYSDSEGSDDERPQAPAQKTSTPASTAATTKPGFAAIVDKSNPRKIRVNLSEKAEQEKTNQDGQPAAKRARVGGGAFSGFNAMLPAPKQTTQTTNGTSSTAKGAPRRVFSLKTGAEPGFDRAADAELKQLFAKQEPEPKDYAMNGEDTDVEAEKKLSIVAPTDTSNVPRKGNPIMFKPLSVARNPQKKKKPPLGTTNGVSSPVIPSTKTTNMSATAATSQQLPTPVTAPKASLFSMGSEADVPTTAASADYTPLVYAKASNEDEDLDQIPSINDNLAASMSSNPQPQSQPQSLQSIASDLNLSASAQRQLFGRSKPSSNSSSNNIINIRNFNTDEEYAANEVMRQSGEAEANQHKGVKAIAPGKHSLKQLISSASGQMEALEESFASGRRNKKEAGGKYGW